MKVQKSNIANNLTTLRKLNKFSQEGQRATVKAEMNGFTLGLDRRLPSR